MRREWKHWNSTIQLCVCVSGCLTSQSFWFSVLVLVTAYHLRSLGGDKCGAKEIATSSIAIIKKRPFQESLPSQWNTTSHLLFKSWAVLSCCAKHSFVRCFNLQTQTVWKELPHLKGRHPIQDLQAVVLKHRQLKSAMANGLKILMSTSIFCWIYIMICIYTQSVLRQTTTKIKQ